MKTIVFSLALFCTTLTTFAQSEQYTAAMTEALGSLKKMTAKPSVADMQAEANKFERIATAEPEQWLPVYYAGLYYSYLGFMGSGLPEKDKFLDMATDYANKAENLAPKNDEVYVLKAQIAQAKMVADPRTRSQQYGPVMSAELAKAIALNPENPRIYALQGSSLYYTPAEYGGGADMACPVLNKAMAKFSTFKPASPIHPDWGRESIEHLMDKCK